MKQNMDKLAPHYYFRSNFTQRGYKKKTYDKNLGRKRKISDYKSQRLAYQFRKIIEKSCFSD